MNLHRALNRVLFLEGVFVMAHRRTSGAKVRSHKIGFNKAHFQHRKQARLEAKRLLVDVPRLIAE